MTNLDQYPHYNTLKENVLLKYKNPIFFETGTYLGDSVDLALKVGFSKIISVEIEEYLQKENRLIQPESCDSEIYRVMQLCWNSNPKQRYPLLSKN